VNVPDEVNLIPR